MFCQSWQYRRFLLENSNYRKVTADEARPPAACESINTVHPAVGGGFNLILPLAPGLVSESTFLYLLTYLW